MQENIIWSNRGQLDYPCKVTGIKGDTIITDGYGDIAIKVVSDKGESKIVSPNSGTHTFENASYVVEYPENSGRCKTVTNSILTKNNVLAGVIIIVIVLLIF